MRRMSTVAAAAVMMLVVVWSAGCTNWQMKYETCNANLENLSGLFEAAQAAAQECEGSQSEIATELAAARRQLQEMQGKGGPGVVDAGFEGEKTQIDTRRGTITVPLESEVLFDAGQVTLKSGSKSRLGRIAQTIKERYGDKEVWVVGHTDTDPIKKSKWKDNWQLSTERALAVTRQLVSEGVDAKRLSAAGRGEYHPLKNKQESRRVEIVVFMY